MKKLDPKNVFSLFEASDEEIFKQEGQAELLKDDGVLLGMAVNGMENYAFLDEIYTAKYGDAYLDHADRIQYRYFCKLFNYLERIKFSKLEPLMNLVDVMGEGSIFYSLEELLEYFVEEEEYEKCARIKHCMDVIESLRVLD